MIFLKLTRTAKNFFTRFGWLIAELVFVFLGLYGAFLLERANDDKNDLMRKRQILEALVDEFVEYESDLIAASEKLDEGYGIPFFTAYSGGEKPFPQPLPFGHGGGLGDLNTGIWEAMLQSGGIDVLEVEMIQEVQQFFKKFEDMLSVYGRFERMVELMIMPELDQNNSFFYEPEGPELRDKFKWYVHQLFTIGMSLRGLSEQAGSTKQLLQGELEKTLALQQPKTSEKPRTTNPRKRSRRKQSVPPKSEMPKVEVEIEAEEEEVREEIPPESTDNLSSIRSKAVRHLIRQCEAVENFFENTKSEYDDTHAFPFFSAYSEGSQPVPAAFIENVMEGIKTEPLSKFLASKGIEEVLPGDLLDSLRRLVGKIEETRGLNQEFIKLSEAQISSLSFPNVTLFYDENATELKEEFKWYPNLLYSMGLALEGCQTEAASILVSLTAMEDGMQKNLQVADSENTEQSSEPVQVAEDSRKPKDEN